MLLSVSWAKTGTRSRLENRRTLRENLVKTPVRVVLVDDYEPWRSFERLTLLAQENLHIVGEAADGDEAVQKVQKLQPDVILLDISLPGLNGIFAARAIRQLAPASKILFVSENRSPDIAEEALRTGATGFVIKSDAARELLPAIRTVLEGKRFISASLAGHFLVGTLAGQTISWLVTLIAGIS
jgi:DNA-binding NarL/FixJ family response regulator